MKHETLPMYGPRYDCDGILIHLLHRLDLTDPAIPFSIPGLRWLPLYYYVKNA